MADPVVETVTAVQRDTAASFLVDVVVTVFDPDADDLTLTVEWAHDAAGPWTAASAQTVDRKHDAVNPLTGIPTASPGKAFNYVWQPFFDLGDGSFVDVHVRATVDDGGAQDSLAIGPLTISASEPETTTQVLDKALARRAILSRTPFDFLGVGLLYPFRRGSRDFVSGEGVDLVRASVRQILGTRATHGDLVGELPWRPDFGSKLWVLRHRANDPTLADQAEAFAREALLWEPRAEVTEVVVEQEPAAAPNELRVRVKYRVIEEDVTANRVFLPEFEEVVTIGA